MIAVVTDRRAVADTVLLGACSALEAAGEKVMVLTPGSDEVSDLPAWAGECPAVVNRSRGLVGVAVVSAFAAAGVLAFNAPRASAIARNAVATRAVLSHHGVQTPATWLTADPMALRRAPREWFPLVVKPFDDRRPRDLYLLGGPEDAALMVPWASDGSLVVVQQFVDSDGCSVELSGVGSRVWALRKHSSVVVNGDGRLVVRSVADGEPIAVDESLRDVALTSGRGCGLDLWAVDVVVSSAGPSVVGVSDVPTYAGVPDAGTLIAEHVMAGVEMEEIIRTAGGNRAVAIIRESP